MVLFVVSSIIIKAQIGWVLQTNSLWSGEEAMIGKIHFVSLNEGWIAASGGRFLHTTDGGNNWSIVDSFPNDTVWNFSDPAMDMVSVNQNYGWIPSKAGDTDNTPYLQYTADGGSTWSTLLTPFGDPQGSNAIFSIFFFNSENG